MTLLLDKSNDSSRDKVPKDSGIFPVRALFDKLRTYSDLSSPNSFGIGPSRLLQETSIKVSISVCLDINVKLKLFYYSAYFCYYSWASLYYFS